MDSSNRAPMIMFNTYTTQFTCSHHGILIREKITTYLDTKVKSKRTCFLCEELIKTRTPHSTRGKLHERVKLFFMQREIGDFHNDFILNKSKNQPTTTVTTKYLENIMLLTLEIKNLSPHQVKSVLGLIMQNDLALIPRVKYRMNSLKTIVPYPWKVDVQIAS